MIETLNEFKLNFERRFNSQSILTLGEDSVRYDFFIALMNNFNFAPHDIQVEFPIHSDAYIPSSNPNSRRNENPQIDLFCSHQRNVMTAEFALFKRNSNANGQIDTTEKVFKMLNDMLRLALNRYYLPNESYFICVADSKIIGKQMRNNILPSFPGQLYSFSYLEINSWIENIKSANSKFDKRFVAKANMLQLTVSAELVFNERLQNPVDTLGNTNDLETRVLVYKLCN
jgi:hypothetical protein